MTTTTPTGATPAPTLPTQSARAAMLTSDFDTFLRMLTTQIQNQDPLNPMQSTEFATQLATFAGVEQQVRTNDQLAGLSRQLGLSSLAQLSSWIGMEVRSAAPVEFTGTPISLSPNPPALADRTELVVLDTYGQEVQRSTIPTSAAPIEWAGTSASGDPLPLGRYSFRLDSFSAGEALGQQPVEHYAAVREARADADGGILLVLAGDITTTADSVTAVRRASGF